MTPAPTRSRTKESLARAIAVASLVLSIVYLGWRLVFTLSIGGLWLSIPFFLLEVYGAISLGLFIFSVWDIDSSVIPKPVSQTDLTIAVLIPTYNEDVEVLLPTVSASVALAPNHETWVLDDGNRDWVRSMAESVGARYVRRGDNSHAKAGNLNHALKLVKTDLVAVLDADHVPSAGFLTDTIGYFDDPKLALVQTPQDFYNTDSFEHVGQYQEEAMFYRVIQPGKNRWGAAFWCGTSALLRTEALRSVGGVATESLTEDLQTTMKLHRRGWRTVFHNDVLARGLAPASYLEYAVQRRRWGAGAMQILRNDNPFTKPGLSSHQRLAYLATFSGWFEGIRTLGYFLAAIAVVVTGTAPIDAPLHIFLPLYGAVFASQQVAMLLLARGRHSFGAGILFDFFRLPASIRAMGRLIAPNGARFLVTPKGRAGSERSLGHLPSSLMILSVTGLVAWTYFVLSTFGLTPTLYRDFGVVVVALFFLVLDLMVLFVALGRATSWRFAADRRGARRFEAPVSVDIAGRNGKLYRPSVTGGVLVFDPRPTAVGASIGPSLNVGDKVSVAIDDGTTFGSLAATVMKVRGDGYALAFADEQWATQAILARALFNAQLQELPLDEDHAGVVLSFHELFHFEESEFAEIFAA
ncbi:MAG: glycosyltransferase [Acidimicrobiales bacterium]